MSENLSQLIKILLNRFNRGEYQEVIKKIYIIFKKQKNNDFLWNLSGLCFQKLDKFEEAIFSFKRSIEINSNNLAAQNNLALTYKLLKNFHEAEIILKKIIKSKPSYINALVNLGNLKNETYYFEEALSYFHKVLKINNNLPEIYLNISNIYQAQNNIKLARETLFKCIELDKFFTQADQSLSMLQSYKNNENLDHVKDMLEKLQNPNLKDEQIANLHFGLGKAFDDNENFEKAFYHYNIANTQKSKNQKSKIYHYKNMSKNIKEFFSDLKTFNIREYTDNRKVIFVLGLPRSGTTLLEKIISSHSEVGSVSECNFIISKISQNILKQNQFKNELALELLNSDFSKHYFDFLKLFNINKKFIVDKSLNNFWYIGFINLFFPNSKIIHSQRNPKDNCLSIYKNNFPSREKWAYDQEEMANYYLIYKDLMNFWNNKFPNRIFNINYEDLINNSEVKTKEIIDYCELEWEDQCLKHQNNKNPIKTLSVNQANKPIYNTSINISANYEKNLNKMFSILDK